MLLAWFGACFGRLKEDSELLGGLARAGLGVLRGLSRHDALAFGAALPRTRPRRHDLLLLDHF